MEIVLQTLQAPQKRFAADGCGALKGVPSKAVYQVPMNQSFQGWPVL
jgi:hypothetical protein